MEPKKSFPGWKNSPHERRNMMSKVQVNHIEIAYSIHGSGDPLILIGGFGQVRETWRLQVDDFKKDFSVITFDNRGVGNSTVPSEPFTIADMAEDTVGLMDALGIESAHIFGVSMGGLISQTIALDHPKRVKKVCLGCTSHGGRHAVQPAPQVFATLALASDPSIPPEQAIRKALPYTFSERFIREEPEKVEEYVQMTLKHQPTPMGATGQMAALSVFNVKRRLGEIRCPVLVITGTEDRLMPPENAHLLVEGISNAELYRVEGAGHAFCQEKPEEVNKIIGDFFKK